MKNTDKKGIQLAPKATVVPNLGGGVSTAKADKSAPDTKISMKSSKSDIFKELKNVQGKLNKVKTSGAKMTAQSKAALVPSQINKNEAQAEYWKARANTEDARTNVLINAEARKQEKHQEKQKEGKGNIATLAAKPFEKVSRKDFRDYAAANRYLGTDPKSQQKAIAQKIMKRNKAIGKGIGTIGAFIKGLRQGH